MMKNSHFYNTLKIWYLNNMRDLPWRKSKNPYSVWLSEIILQQTRIDQGTAYYLKFLEKYPDIHSLARANEDDILKLWQGLGYYSRARNLHKTAIYISEQLNGNFPENYNDLIKLKGIGDYTASAIASICFNEHKAVVDGNVYRFLSRYFGIFTAINSSKGQKEFKETAQSLLNLAEPGNHNQAIMDFGALVCKPKNPKCNDCPFKNSCYAKLENNIKSLPVKSNKTAIKTRYFNYLIVNGKNKETLILKRTENDIWKNLYEFPLIESESQMDMETMVGSNDLQNLLSGKSYCVSMFNPEPIKHKLTHQHLYTTFWIIETNDAIQGGISWEKLINFALPTLVQNFVDEYKNVN